LTFWYLPGRQFVQVFSPDPAPYFPAAQDVQLSELELEVFPATQFAHSDAAVPLYVLEEHSLQTSAPDPLYLPPVQELHEAPFIAYLPA
jgi:hypothetical protein